jgi:fructosamine-3-kinase
VHVVDLAYLRAHPQHLPVFLTHQRIRETPVPGGDICDAARLTLDDGNSLFAKSWPGSATEPVPDGFFAAEARGLSWLREAGGAPVPEVLIALPTVLAMEWVDPAAPTPRAAERLGRDLAATHRAGSPAFGAPWPGYIGRLPLDATPADDGWPGWFAAARLRPYLRRSADRGALAPDDVALVDRVVDRIVDLAGPAGGESPARLHGDLWPGNLLWSGDGGRADRVWLVDPAAQGGHRETDLATLALFGGAPHLERILAAYHEAWPLADGWPARRPLHQLHLLLVHTALFGAAYRDAVRAAAVAALRAG